jgi:formylglycine-generating enzyme
MSNMYKYDVAISFAEEDRNAALAMALALNLIGFKKVYYYPDHRSSGVGLDIKEKLIETYNKDARYVVFFLSKSFFKKDKIYTKIELQAIKQRIISQPEIQYVIPILLDTKLDLKDDKVLSGREYIKWEYNPKEIAKMLKDNFGNKQPLEDKGEEKGNVYISQIANNSGGGNQENNMDNLTFNF